MSCWTLFQTHPFNVRCTLFRLNENLSKQTNTWRSFHQTAKETYTSMYPGLVASFVAGEYQPLHLRLVYFALNFAPATSTNRAAALGFYDTFDGTVKVKQVGEHYPPTSCL